MAATTVVQSAITAHTEALQAVATNDDCTGYEQAHTQIRQHAYIVNAYSQRLDK